MPKFIWFLIVFVLGAMTVVEAGQAPPRQTEIQQVGPADQMFLKLMEEMKDKKPIKSQNGVGPVGTEMASICPSCKKPLYLHSDPNFECLPVDPRTLEPRQMIKILTRQAQCAVCGAQFEGALPGNLNAKAGIDRDYCTHSVGIYSVYSNVWICPDCGYAGLIDNFGLGLDGKPLDDATKAFVREKLAPQMRERMIDVVGLVRHKDRPIPAENLVFSKYVKQNEIPDWIKFDNAMQIYERMKAPHSLMALLYVDAAHACRREVCKEIAAMGLNNEAQEQFGKALRVVDARIRAECFNIRRARSDAVIDPNKIEADPWVLAQAGDAVIRASAEAGGLQNASQSERELNNGELFVLNLREAGYLDRVGRIQKADDLLEKARGYIPQPESGANEEDTALKQINVLRHIVDDRQSCLRREREYLFNAARAKSAALKFKEIPMQDYNHFWRKTEQRNVDPAVTTYLLGELLRRAEAQEDALPWFQASDAIINQELATLDSIEKSTLAELEKKGTPIVQPEIGPVEFDAERRRLLTLKQWVKEQKGQTKTTKQAEAYVTGVVSQVLESLKLDPAAIIMAAPQPHISISPETKNEFADPTVTSAPAKTTAAEPKAAPQEVKGNIKTREQLYKLYYEALSKYRKDKNVNAPNLSELVKTGYISKDDSNLDEDGKLFCPETHVRIGYMRSWNPAESSSMVLFPITPGSKILYSDGQIRSAK